LNYILEALIHTMSLKTSALMYQCTNAFSTHLEKFLSMIHKIEQLCPLQGRDENALKPWIDACKCFHVVHWCDYNMLTLMLGYGWYIIDGIFLMTWHVLDHHHRKAMSHLCQESFVPSTRPQPKTIVGICY
jgi:hypothetical protein